MLRQLTGFLWSLLAYPLSYADRKICEFPNLTDSEDQWGHQ